MTVVLVVSRANGSRTTISSLPPTEGHCEQELGAPKTEAKPLVTSALPPHRHTAGETETDTPPLFFVLPDPNAQTTAPPQGFPRRDQGHQGFRLVFVADTDIHEEPEVEVREPEA